MLVATWTSTEPFAQAATGLIAGYPFSEGSGSTSADASGNGFTATLVSAPAWAPGKSGTALFFNGSTSYVDLGNPAALQLTGSMTLSAWVFELANVADDGQIIAKSDGTGWQLKSSPDTGPRTFAVAVTNPLGGQVQRYSSTVRALNRWYHVAGVYDATARTLSIYVNGILDNGVLTGTVPASQRNSSVNVNIGRRTGGFNIRGTIDDVRLYARALSASEIQTDMNTPLGGAPAFDFTLSNEGNESVVRGSAVANAITSTLTSGATQPVSFAASGLPTGTTASFDEPTCSPTCTTNLTLSTSASTPIGTSTVTVMGAGGSVSRTTAFSLTVAAADATPPVVALTAPAASATVGGTAVTVSASASDAVGVAGVQFLLDGADLGAEALTSPYSIAWDSTTATNGPHVLSARARDAAGNTATATSVAVLVDNQPPTGSVIINGGAAATNTLVVILTLSASDTASSVTQMRFSNTGSSYSAAEAYATTKVWILSAGAGTKTVYVQFKDAPGNWSGASTDTIVYDAAAPTISSVASSNVTSSAATVSWTTDEAATSQVEYGPTSAYGSLTALDSTLVTVHTVVLGGLSSGTQYSYRVRSRDAAGNEALGANNTFTTTGGDTTPPSVPANLVATAVSSTQVGLSWSASTDNVGVTGYIVLRNGVQAATPSTPSFQDTGRTPATTYTYTVSARDAAGNVSAPSAPASATTPSGTSGEFQNEVLVSGLNLPTALKFLPDGHLLVLELGGTIRRVHPDDWDVDSVPFLVLTNIGTASGQQGLMDMVLDPDFALNHYYYVFYTLGTPNRDRVSRFTAKADLSGTVPGSELAIYQDPSDASTEHHGGALNFGNDGKLYVTTGEHFDADMAQSLTSPRGKLLRFNKDGTVPTDNPFYDGTGPRFDAIWALGLRNPFRAFYDSPTGRLYIADVGGNAYATAEEEVHLGARGANYGWPICEGFSCGSNPAYTSPIFAYGHDGRDASITGGFIYRGSQFPAQYQGNYFFADYAQNWIKRLTLAPSGTVTGVFNFEPPDGTPDGPYGDIVYLCQGPDGALYYVDLGYSDTTGESGVSKIRRIRFISNNQPPDVVATLEPTEGPAPLTVTFSSAGTSDPEDDPLTYLWTFGDGATSTEANPVHTYVSKGAYVTRLAVSDGSNTSLSPPQTVYVGTRPVPLIVTPSDGLLFRAGDTISFSGEAQDAEDGVMPAAAFTWTIDFLHEGHVHPGLPQVGVRSGTFAIPTSGHDFSGFTRYQITLTVTDSDGLQGSQSVLIFPEKVNLTFDSLPNGLSLTLDGIPHTTRFIYDTLVDFQHTISAPNQVLGQNGYTFASWSDGGAQQHTIVVPAAPQSYTAAFDVGQVPLPAGLVAGYRFGEGAGATTADLSGNNNTGTLVSGPTWTTGQYGNALAFGGTSYVNLGNPATLQLTGSMTLTAWIRIATQPVDDGAIIAKLGPAGWQLKTSADTGARTAAIQISSNGSDTIQRYGRTVLVANTWYHVAGVFDAAGRTLSVYLNGVLDNGTLSGTVPAVQYNAPLNVNIAQRTGNPALFNFLGTIDEAHVFNRALTAAEIDVDMRTPR